MLYSDHTGRIPLLGTYWSTLFLSVRVMMNLLVSAFPIVTDPGFRGIVLGSASCVYQVKTTHQSGSTRLPG